MAAAPTAQARGAASTAPSAIGRGSAFLLCYWSTGSGWAGPLPVLPGRCRPGAGAVAAGPGAGGCCAAGPGPGGAGASPRLRAAPVLVPVGHPPPPEAPVLPLMPPSSSRCPRSPRRRWDAGVPLAPGGSPVPPGSSGSGPNAGGRWRWRPCAGPGAALVAGAAGRGDNEPVPPAPPGARTAGSESRPAAAPGPPNPAAPDGLGAPDPMVLGLWGSGAGAPLSWGRPRALG